MVHFRLALPVAVLAMALLTGRTAADEPQPPAGGYTPATLQEALTRLGYDPKPVSGLPGFIISVEGELTIYVRVSLSSDGTTLWLTSTLAVVNDPAMAPQAVRRLLVENDRIGPARFLYSAETHSIKIESPTGNRAMSPVKLRKAIEGFSALVHKTAPLWLVDEFVRIGSVPAELVQSELNLLMGEWRLVQAWDQGKPVSADQLKQTNPRIRFDATQLSSITSDKTTVSEFVLDPRGPVKRLDMIDNKRVTTGIYQLQGDTLTLVCNRGPGVERPKSFEVKPGDKLFKFVLTRVTAEKEVKR